MQTINIAIIGLGTVGGGALRLLQENASEIARRTGCDARVTHVGIRSNKSDHDLNDIVQSADLHTIVRDPSIHIVVEVIGGTTLAGELIREAIIHGKHVVTANKALLAEHGNELFDLAEKHQVQIAYEAAVAGGIPIIKVLREGLAANTIESLAGIINGTSNFILTEMRDKGRSFDDVLSEAQALGYAEADPTFDVEGVDAAHKLTLLASNAFGIPLQFDQVVCEGIRHIQSIDVRYAEELGYRIKLLGIAKRTKQGIELRVHPTLIPQERLIANVNGVKNAVLVNANAVGATLYYGAGAGAGPTASAIVADIIDLMRLIHAGDHASAVPHLAFQPHQLTQQPIVGADDIISAYYLRIDVQDAPGVLAQITDILRQHGINIEAVLQKPHALGLVPVVIITEAIITHTMQKAILAIEALNAVKGPVIRIRSEDLDD